jgi:hypothetical protein
MILNQLRHKIGVTFGSPETTTGGNALKFYASMRLDVRRIGQVKIGDELVGGRTRVKLAKNKMAPPFTEAEFEIRWGRGVDALSELIDLGLTRELIDKSGNHMSFAGEALGNGRERSRETLAASAELQSTLRQAILASGPVRPESAASGSRRATPTGASLLHLRDEGVLRLLHLVRRQVLHVLGDAPLVAPLVHDTAEPVAPEHVGQRHLHRTAGVRRPLERRVYAVDVDPELRLGRARTHLRKRVVHEEVRAPDADLRRMVSSAPNALR